MFTIKNLVLLAGALLPFVAGVPVERGDATIIPGKFIVTLKQGIAKRDADAHLDWVNGIHERGRGRPGGVKKTYETDRFRGYSGSFDEATVEAIKSDPNVSPF
jgi:oryzin